MNNRPAKMLMDNLCGKSMREIGDEHGLCAQRVHQLIARARSVIGWHPGMTKQQVGAALVRCLSGADLVRQAQTPFEHHIEIERECASDGR